MTDPFLTGFILGGGIRVPEAKVVEVVDPATRAQLEELKQQNRQLKAEIKASAAVSNALLDALHHENPEHPLADPFALGENPLRNKIAEAAYNDPAL